MNNVPKEFNKLYKRMQILRSNFSDYEKDQLLKTKHVTDTEK